jgi:Cupin-like domain
MTVIFQPVEDKAFPGTEALRGRKAPTIFRGHAADWPGVREWTFDKLAGMLDEAPVTLVEGDREMGSTQFVSATLRQYIAALGGDHAASAGQPPYLKEFDLLRAAPALRADLRHEALLPRRCMSAMRSWIGPAGGATGLHRDFLDNIAVQVMGRKRWRLARPGAVERAGAVSPKYDAWAVLSSRSVEQLLHGGVSAQDLYEVETGPGDVLHVPAGWWHEVLNLSPSVLFGGFHGPVVPVLARWAWVGVRNARHRWGSLGRGDCTCHPVVEPRPEPATERPSCRLPPH